MFRKFGTSTAAVCLAATIVKVAEIKQPTRTADETAHFKCKPSELPLYKPLHAYKKVEVKQRHPEDSVVRKTIQNGVSAVRVEVFKVYNFVSSRKNDAVEFIETGKAHSKFIFDYLNEPDNSLPRIGAIAIGGLSGFIFALRGGFIRRVFYTSLGASAIASICYPKQAEKYAQNGLVEAKKGANIAYNFAFGIKPGDEVNTINWPKIPTNVSEITDSISDLARSAKDSLFSLKK